MEPEDETLPFLDARNRYCGVHRENAVLHASFVS
jgi:hypothetical protein